MLQAFTQAARLKPEIRLAQAISEFGALLDGKHLATFKTFRTQTPLTTNGVIRLTEEINRDGSRLHRAWRPYGTRLLKVLDQLQVLVKAGDLLVGGSQNMIASGVWAAVRVSLQVRETQCLPFHTRCLLTRSLDRHRLLIILQRSVGASLENWRVDSH